MFYLLLLANLSYAADDSYILTAVNGVAGNNHYFFIELLRSGGKLRIICILFKGGAGMILLPVAFSCHNADAECKNTVKSSLVDKFLQKLVHI